MNLGEERFDSIDSDKKPRAGQILWIRGLTRLQTQVSQNLCLYPLQKQNKYFIFFTNNFMYFIVFKFLLNYTCFKL